MASPNMSSTWSVQNINSWSFENTLLKLLPHFLDINELIHKVAVFICSENIRHSEYLPVCLQPHVNHRLTTKIEKDAISRITYCNIKHCVLFHIIVLFYQFWNISSEHCVHFLSHCPVRFCFAVLWLRRWESMAFKCDCCSHKETWITIMYIKWYKGWYQVLCGVDFSQKYSYTITSFHDDVMIWKRFPHYWSFM